MLRLSFNPFQLLKESTLFQVRRTEQGERRTTWLELFFDLIFVAAIAQISAGLYQDPTLNGVFRFSLLFVPIWWCWAGATHYASQFSLHELTNRLLTFAEIIAATLLAVYAGHALAEDSQAFILCYVAMRAMLIARYGLTSLHLAKAAPGVRNLMGAFILGASLWLVSFWLPPPWRYGAWALGIGVDIARLLTARRAVRQSQPNLTHLPERFGLFTLIVLGESVTAVVHSLDQQRITLADGVSGVLALLGAFCFWWLYFDEICQATDMEQRIIRKPWTLPSWILCHLFLSVGLVATGAGVKHVLLSPQMALLNARPLALLTCAVGLSLLSLGGIHICTRSLSVRRKRSLWLQHCVIGVLLIGLAIPIWTGALSWSLPPMAALGLLVAICLLQVWVERVENRWFKPFEPPEALLVNES